MNQVTLKVVPALGRRLHHGAEAVRDRAALVACSSPRSCTRPELPAGVFNLVNGDGPGVGRQLSAPSGRRHGVASPAPPAPASRSSRRAPPTRSSGSTLELGGKGANIDLRRQPNEKAVTPRRARLLLQLGPVLQRADPDAGRTVDLRPGRGDRARNRWRMKTGRRCRPRSTADHIGPVVSQAQFDKIQGLIATGMDEGARLRRRRHRSARGHSTAATSREARPSSPMSPTT